MELVHLVRRFCYCGVARTIAGYKLFILASGSHTEIVLILTTSYKSHVLIGVVIGQLQYFISFFIFTRVSHSEIVLS